MVAADWGECCEAAGPCCASRHCRGEAFIRNGKKNLRRNGLAPAERLGGEQAKPLIAQEVSISRRSLAIV
jgi:hypothetical protein